MVSTYEDSISLKVGEPDFPIPPHIVKSGKEAQDTRAEEYDRRRRIIFE